MLPDEILSQNEIDALLSALSTGEMRPEDIKKDEEGQKVRRYDFKRALRFSKDQIRSIARIHENYARLLTTFFSGQLRTYVNISVASVDQIPYKEFIRSIPEMTILNVYRVEPLEGNILLEVNQNIAFSMMDRILGGKGDGIPADGSLTEIESLIISQLFKKTTANLKEAWASLVDIEPDLETFEVNPHFLQLVSPNETVVVVSLVTEIASIKGMIHVCIPHLVLEPVIHKLSVHYWMETGAKERDPENYEQLKKHFEQVEVEATAILGQTEITLGQFLNLKPDDIISLQQKITDPLQLMIQDKPKMLVQPGKMNNQIAVQVLEAIKEGT
jgi:flagellar motor switch protein FliM